MRGIVERRRLRTFLLAPLILIASEWLPARVLAEEDSTPLGEAETAEGLLVRPTLTGNWGGSRDELAGRGVSLDADVTYTFQWVAGGGLDGAVFDQFSDEEDTGNTVSLNLNVELGTAAAGLWRGGFFNFRLEGRAGRSVLQRAGSVSAVDNDALFPNEVDQFDEETVAITELTFTQYFGDHVAVYAGLLDTAEGDENEIAGSALSNAHFLNSALLYSLVEDATVPNVSLGGGLLFEPSDTLYGSFSVFATQETAGEDPFEHTQGTTFSTEWTLGHTIRSRSGAQTLGLLYGIDASRIAIATDPRRVLASVLLGLPIPDTNDDTWAIYYNAHQYLHGDAEGGWGAFVRFGTSDGDPNPVEWTVAAGLGGVGGVLERPNDSWGLGAFYLGLSDEDLLEGLNVEEEVGGELFYNVAVTPWLHVTPDVQVIDSALPRSDTTWVISLRTHVDL